MIDPRIAEGVKLVPELQNEMFEGNPWITLRSGHVETIIAALTAAGEMERELAEAREAALEEAAKVCERDITSLTVIEFDGSRRTLDDRELEVVKFAIKGRAAVIRDLRRAARAYAGTTKGELT